MRGRGPAAPAFAHAAGRWIHIHRERRRPPSRYPAGGMTVTGDPVRLGDDQHPGAPATRIAASSAGSGRRDVCPYLVAGDGSWQSAHAIREHRCGAVEPAVPLDAREAAPAVPRRRTPDLCHVPRRPGARDHDWERARAGARRRADPVARDPLDAAGPRTRAPAVRPKRIAHARGRPGRADRADGRRLPAADRRAHVVAVDPARGSRRVRLGTRGRVADAAGHAVARGIAHGVRRPVRDPSADAEADGRTQPPALQGEVRRHAERDRASSSARRSRC